MEADSISVLSRMGRLILARKEIRISDVSKVWEYFLFEMKKIAILKIETSDVKPTLKIIGLLYN
tara:strand:- start:490 stop:681 length:192 start_codon:yes stop_codon:yes gene_type:complete